MKEKEVVDLKKEPGVVAGAPTQPKPKTFRFKKIRFPLKPVKLGDRTVEFHQIKLTTGGKSKFSVFETQDPKLADKLREAAKDKSQHIFEV